MKIYMLWTRKREKKLSILWWFIWESDKRWKLQIFPLKNVSLNLVNRFFDLFLFLLIVTSRCEFLYRSLVEVEENIKIDKIFLSQFWILSNFVSSSRSWVFKSSLESFLSSFYIHTHKLDGNTSTDKKSKRIKNSFHLNK